MKQFLAALYTRAFPSEAEYIRIEKVIKRDNKNKKALVKWVGYSDKHNLGFRFLI